MTVSTTVIVAASTRIFCAASLVVTALAATAVMASAQSLIDVHGLAIDRATKAGVASAHISVAEDDTSRAIASRQMMSDSAGRFEFRAIVGQRYRIVVRRLGFQPFAAAFRLDSIQDTVIVNLDAVAATLGPTIVEASAISRQLELKGFYDRQHFGFGKFFDSATVARFAAGNVFTFLHPYIRGCTRIFVDGMALAPLQDADPATVKGIEVYASNLEAPPMFYNPAEKGSARCGSIVVWRFGG